MPSDILITAALPPFLYDPLRAGYRCHDLVHAADRDALLAAEGPRVRGLVQSGASITPTTLLDRLPALGIISVFGVGYDGVPVAYCRERGIVVAHTPDVLTDDVADIAVALVLLTSRRLVAADRFVRDGRWLAGGFPLASCLGGKKVGILGLGRIGRAIARRLQAMEMDVAYTTRRPQPDVPWRHEPDLLALAAAVDVLIVACPGGPATHKLVDAGVLAALGPAGTLVNIARGSIVDEPALIEALQSGALGGAGLDVFADEPRVPAALLALDNVVLLPHIGSATRETRQAMGDLCRANLDAWFAGRPVPAVIPELAA